MNFERECDDLKCGRRYIAHRANSRFCSDRCRVNSHQRGTRRGPVAPLTDQQAAVAAPNAPPERPGPPPEEPGDVTSAVEKALADARRSGTVSGQLARVLAMRLDNGRGESGAGLSSLAKHLETLMDKALAGAPAAPDELDELEQRRLAKLAEAGVGA